MIRALLILLALAMSPTSSFGFAPSPKNTFMTRSMRLDAKNANYGIFSPVVEGAKAVLGTEELNKLRGKVIAEHSNVIAKFVDTSESEFGRIALRALFDAADKDGNGTLDKDEVRAALNALGFSWFDDKKASAVVSKADIDENAVIDFEEFVQSAPKTLRTNLVKLAKQNGNDLGFLV